MAKSDLGTKRTCPDTGKKFYDLNRGTIVSPYTNTSFSRSYFEKASNTDDNEECKITENIEAKSFAKHRSSDEEENSESKKDNASLDLEYAPEIDIENEDVLLEESDDDTDSRVVDIDITDEDDS
ncbi:TIGR02300 family protein [Candidatus Liberibacter americanus]|uniref:TIGR02300 family protein n=1 Tax=Candidatus Liberibacter americanus TaxID=309868 RepID=UPI0002C60D57|nr:TIGR02300 family protein [Candidatus Liberibacter americanus]EMS36570.1 hypothetical protein G653_01397 [Candidatus Liberibacter americanus PW_SP]